jgi:RNA polymerase sigma factor (sigma-70 family)
MTGSPLERDTPLIRAAQEGDTAAFAQLVRLYERIAFRTACFVAGPDDAEEVAQLGLIKAYYALKRFQLGRPFQPWLLQIVVNEAKTARRAASRRTAILTRALAEAGSNIGDDQAANRILKREADTELAAALARLPDKHRDVVTCRYLLQLSEEETARVLGLRVGTIKSRLSRALVKLRTELEQQADEAHPAGTFSHVARQSA